MKRISTIVTTLAVIAMLAAACGPAVTTVAPSTAVPPIKGPAVKVGEVTDMGGVNDKSFNALGWKGVTDAIAQLGVDGKYLESTQQSDYAKNLQQMLSENQNLIVTVGFLLGVDTALAAKANPNSKFAIVDYTYPDCWPGAVEGKECGSSTDLTNVRGLSFQTDQAAFLAGYLAAGMTKTGKVGTFGGIPIPTVTIFMKGFQAGVKYYNQKHGTAVETLGWDDLQQTGLFTGNFNSTDDGKSFATSLVQEGADIILPVAGPVGLGSAAYCQTSGKCLIIGVDTDWFVSANEYASVELSSVQKKVDVAVYKTIEDVVNGKFTGGTISYALADGGVDLAPFHDFDSQVPQTLKDELAQAKADIISGALTVNGVLKPIIKVGEVTDMGGVNDKSFNALGWKGVTDAMQQFGVDGKYLQSSQQSDYAKNLQQFLSEKQDLIVTVGFLLGVDTATFAKANPTQKFAIVDYTYPDCWPGAVEGKDCGSATDIPNVRGLSFQTDQAAFLAGYLAAGMTKTGKVGTFGGIQIPTVTIFMKGFEAGVKYYNQKHGTTVEVMGWDNAAGKGLFTGNFNSLDDGKAQATSLVQEGADIVMPVAGPVGLGSAAYCQSSGKCLLIGVDTDWFVSANEYANILLSSVQKKVDVAVYKSIRDVINDEFTGGTVNYALADGGVDLAPFHDFDGQVPQSLKDELAQAKADLISGALTVDGVLSK
jgi:basic membrane protein A